MNKSQYEALPKGFKLKILQKALKDVMDGAARKDKERALQLSDIYDCIKDHPDTVDVIMPGDRVKWSYDTDGLSFAGTLETLEEIGGLGVVKRDEHHLGTRFFRVPYNELEKI
jgi:hypothetical protein